MGRGPSCVGGLKKGPWTAEEDQKLIEYVMKHGQGRWRTVPNGAGLNRCGKSCRLRWTNYLRPDIKRGRFSFEEEETIIQLHSILGNKWSAIAAQLPGRTDNEIKNYWNTRIRKKLLRMGIDPVTHKARLDLLELYHSILNSSLLSSSPQVNFQNLPAILHQTSVNSDLLNLVTSLALSQYSNNGLQSLLQNLQVINQDFHQPSLNPLFSYNPQPYHTPCGQNSLRNLCDEQYSAVAPNLVPVQDVNNGDIDLDYSLVNLLSDNYNTQLLQNSNVGDSNELRYGLGSVMFTPSSSSTQLNSSRTLVNGSCAEEEKDSFCSNIMSKISNPLLDLDDRLCNL